MPDTHYATSECRSPETRIANRTNNPYRVRMHTDTSPTAWTLATLALAVMTLTAIGGTALVTTTWDTAIDAPQTAMTTIGDTWNTVTTWITQEAIRG